MAKEENNYEQTHEQDHLLQNDHNQDDNHTLVNSGSNDMIKDEDNHEVMNLKAFLKMNMKMNQ